jgi:hypothetical protein
MAIITEKKQVFIIGGKYSIAQNELRFLIGRAEPTTAQDAQKQASVGGIWRVRSSQCVVLGSAVSVQITKNDFLSALDSP